MTGPAGGCHSTSTCCWPARASTRARASATTARRSQGPRRSGGGRVKSRKPWTVFSSRATSLRMTARFSAVTGRGLKGRRAASTSILIAISGLRTSCATLAASWPTAASCWARRTSRCRSWSCSATSRTRTTACSSWRSRSCTSPSGTTLTEATAWSRCWAMSWTWTLRRWMDRLSPRAIPQPRSSPLAGPPTPSSSKAACSKRVTRSLSWRVWFIRRLLTRRYSSHGSVTWRIGSSSASAR